jgi:hypothetical protein
MRRSLTRFVRPCQDRPAYRKTRIDLSDLPDKSAVPIHRPLKIGLVDKGADPQKAVDWRQGKAEPRMIFETRENVFEPGEIVRRPVRAARLGFVLLAAGRQSDPRSVGLRSIDAVIERERGLLAGGGRLSGDVRRRLGFDFGSAASASLRRPLTASRLTFRNAGLALPSCPPFSISAISASLASAEGAKSGRPSRTVSMPARQRSPASIAEATRRKP